MDLKFLKELLYTPSVSGDEFKLQKKIIKHLKDNDFNVETDSIGNVYTRINPEAKLQVMIEAHCDEIGFMVRKIDESGYIYLEKVGGISLESALGMKVSIGPQEIKGVVGSNSTEGNITIDKLYVDCGFGSSRLAMEHIKIGDYVSYDTGVEELFGRKLASKALDNKSGLYILIETLKRLREKDLEIGVVGVSTVNEETNTGGAYFAASKIKPNMAIVLDVTFTGDYSGADDLDIYLGGGPVLAIGSPIHPKLLKHFEDAADTIDMPIQYELTPKSTGTSADTIRKTGVGVPVALVSLPIRYMHSPYEVCDIRDINQMIELLVKGIEGIKEDFDLCPFN